MSQIIKVRPGGINGGKKIKLIRRRNGFTIPIIIFLIIILFGSISAFADVTELMINPSSQTVSASETFNINLYCVPGEPIKGYELELSFDASLVKAISVTEGDIFDDSYTFFNAGNIDNSAGLITNIYGLIIGQGNTSSPGTFCTVTFSSKSYSGSSSLKFNSVGEWTGVVNEEGYLSISVTDGSVTVEGESNPPEEPPTPPSQPPNPPSQPPIPPQPNPPSARALPISVLYPSWPN